MLGEDIAAAGGVFKTTVGLLDEFGPERVRDTPISEQAILGAAMGAAMTGIPAIAEIMFSDFLAVCFDMIANEIAKSRYMTNGQVSFPLVVRTANGGGARFGAQHSQSVENWCMMIPGLKVVAPATPEDVVGLMAASIRDPDPVVFFEHKSLMATKADVPDGEIVDELGTARWCGRAPMPPSPPWRSWSPGHWRRPTTWPSGYLGRGDRRSLTGAARHPDHPRVCRQDRALLHRRGEPATVRVGSRAGLDRGRGGLLGFGRPQHPNHHSPHPPSRRVGTGGSGHPLGDRIYETVLKSLDSGKGQ